MTVARSCSGEMMRTNAVAYAFLLALGMAGSVQGQAINNGDFEKGDRGFTSEYTHVKSCGGFGVFMIATSPAKVCPGNWIDFGDHTSGTGRMMIADGSPDADTIIWSETVKVGADTNYIFSYWGASVDPPGLRGSLVQIYINQEPIGLPRKMKSYDGWHRKAVRWNSGANTSATISLIDLHLQESGNDFALDDIGLKQVPASGKR